MTDKPLSIEARHQAVVLEVLQEYDQIVRFVSNQRDRGVESDLRHNGKSLELVIEKSLRRHFGDLGGDYSCAMCGFGMKEPCEHWKKMLAASAESQSPAVNSIREIRPFELPSCHICGAQMTPKTYKCESCKTTTGVAPAESHPPLRVSNPEGHTFSNVSVNGAKVDGAQGSEPTEEQKRACPACSSIIPEEGHAKDCPDPAGEFSPSRTPERRIGPGERREHEEELNPAGNRFRMKWWNWWDDARINIRTGPPDRRRKRDINATTSHWCGIHHRFAPCPECAQPGKKEGESTDAPSTRESTTRAAGTSVTSAAPPRCVTAEAVKAYRHRLMHRDNATKTAPLSSWSDAEVAAFASSLLAERDRTIAERHEWELSLVGQVFRLLTERDDAQNKGHQARQRAGQAEKELLEDTHAALDDTGVELAMDGNNLSVEARIVRLGATAERLRGLLREADVRLEIAVNAAKAKHMADHYGNAFTQCEYQTCGIARETDALRQRIQRCAPSSATTRN